MISMGTNSDHEAQAECSGVGTWNSAASRAPVKSRRPIQAAAR